MGALESSLFKSAVIKVESILREEKEKRNQTALQNELEHEEGSQWPTFWKFSLTRIDDYS
jgi:hypothetical protein